MSENYSGLDERFLETVDEMTWWMYDTTCIGMGAQRQFDYTMRGDLGRDLSPRLGLCYMLAVQAFVGWDHWSTSYNVDKTTLPAPVTMVHGTWQAPGKDRIAHAWVILEDGRVWEPITGLICDPVLFAAYGRTRDSHRYTEHEARVNMLRSGHYGPWEG